MKKLGIILMTCSLGLSANGYAAEYEVGQLNKKFSTDSLSIKAGDTVHFTNQDPFFHNVYSLSSPYFFDLGSYPKGQFKSVVFDHPGVVEVECAIHPKMHMTITVE